MGTYSIWRRVYGTLHLSTGAGFPRDEDGNYLRGIVSQQYIFTASSTEEAATVLDKAIAVWRHGGAAPDIAFRKDLEEARTRGLDYSAYLPFKNKADRDLIKKAYAQSIAEGTRLGFTDEDWDEANGMADTLLRS